MSYWKSVKVKPVGKAAPQRQSPGNAIFARRGSKFKDKPYLDMSLYEMKSPSFERISEEPAIESVGMYFPLYDNRKRQHDSIKERLGDITNRLHQTLFKYDTLNDYEKEVQKRVDVVKNTKNKIQHMEQGEMKATLEAILGQANNYEVSENTIGPLSERDDLLYQLADWFSADHSELNALQISMDKNEENELEKNFNATILTFEKLKRVQKQIKAGKLDTKKLIKLEQEKKKLELDMISNVKEMKTISIQALPPTSGAAEEAVPWKSAADQIVAMLNQARMEGNEELKIVGAHLRELMKNLEKQQKQIKSLQGDLKREKKVIETLSDENTDLNIAISELKEKLTQCQADLEKSKQAFAKLSKEKSTKSNNVPAQELSVKKSNLSVKDAKETVKPPTKSKTSVKSKKGQQEQPPKKLKLTLSGILGEFLQKSDVPPQETCSDPSMLQACIKDQREALHLVSQEVQRLNKNLRDLEESLKHQTSQVAGLIDENDELREKISVIELELQKNSSKSSEISCPRCNGKTENSHSTVTESVAANMDADMDKLRENARYLQKALADTEMKLSTAYKEISDLRLQISFEPEKRPLVPPPTPAEKPTEEEEEEEKEEEEMKQQQKVTRREPVKKSPPKKKGLKLPPIPKGSLTSNLMMEESLPEDLDMPDATCQKEEQLWKLGDLQGRMSQLMKEILVFITQVADLIFIDQNMTPSKDPRFTTLQPSDFENKDAKTLRNEDPRYAEGRQKRSNAFFLGQKAIGCLKEAYELLSDSLSLEHGDYELIYRAFKNHQHQRAIIQAVLAGKLPLSALYPDKTGKFGDLTTVNKTGLWQASSPTKVPSDVLEGHKSALNNAVLVLGIHRSKSEVDVLGVQNVQSELTHGTSQNNLPRELSQVFISTNTQEIERERRTAGLNREETKIPTTTIPKKGLIKLTALNHEVQDPSYYEKQRDEEDDDLWIRKKPLGHISDPHKKLVKKTMLEHMKVGNRMLAEQEKLNQEQEKIEKELGECTIGDLQINLNKMTEELSKKKSEERIKILEKTKRAPLKRQRLQLVERSITLPSIKDFTFG